MNTVDVVVDEADEADELIKAFDHLKLETKPSPIVFKDDPVAMACASHRLWLAGGTRWIELEEAKITEEDRVKSAEIRKYYADRILITMLKNKQVSTFRRKLYGVVTNSIQLDKADVGLLHRLPYFYDEDLATDRVVAQTQAVTERWETQRVTAEFSVIEKVLKSRRAGDYTQFWLRSNQSTAPFMMVIKQDNPYHRLINGVLSRPVTLSGWAHTKYHSGHHRGKGYFYLADIEIVNA